MSIKNIAFALGVVATVEAVNVQSQDLSKDIDDWFAGLAEDFAEWGEDLDDLVDGALSFSFGIQKDIWALGLCFNCLILESDQTCATDVSKETLEKFCSEEYGF